METVSTEQEKAPTISVEQHTSAGHDGVQTKDSDAQQKSNPVLEAIKIQLSVAGLNDKAHASPQLTNHRRSRSLDEVSFKRDFSAAADGKASAKSQKLLNGNVEPPPHEGLEQIKRKLLQEIKVKLREQVEIKKLEAQEKKSTTLATDVVDNETEPQTIDSPAVEQPTLDVQVNRENKDSHAKPVEVENKRFSICSLSGSVDQRKRYSPVYERTKKFVRQSSSSINRWSSSQPQVVQQQSPNSAPVTTNGTAQVLSRVPSKGDLENEDDSQDTVATIPVPDQAIVPNQEGNTTNSSLQTISSSYHRIGQHSAHPSVYVIEQERRGMDGSRSDKMDRSTSTLKRGSSFKGLRNNIKKTFSTQIPSLTLENAEKVDTASNIPKIVECCIETMRMKGLLKTEGLYRSSPSQLEARKGQYDYVRAVDDAVLLAGTLKSFFFNLKNHIISQEVMDKNFPKKCLLGETSEQEYVERLKGLVSDLDTTHYECLEYLTKHLQEVASYSKYNLMTPSNLGVVWAPCLFTNCDKSCSGADLLSFMGEQTRLLELLITNADLLFDRYPIDEIMIAIEDGLPLRDGEPMLNLRPDYDLVNGNDLERRKLMRNLSLTLDNVYEATCSENGGGRNYMLQNSRTAPIIGNAHSDGGTVTGGKKMLRMKRSRSGKMCVIS